MLEASNVGIPIIAIPLFADQLANSYKAVRAGFGVNADKSILTKSKEFAQQIKHVLSNQV